VFNDEFGEVLREVRSRRGMTQLRLGEEIGRSHSYISRVERGGLQADDVDVAMIVRVLELGADDEERLRLSLDRLVRPGVLSGEDVEEAVLTADACRLLRGSGDPVRAWGLSRLTVRRLLRMARVSRLDDPVVDEVVRVGGLLLYEATKAFLDVDFGEVADTGELGEVRRTHEQLCDGCAAPEVQHRLLVGREAALYAAGDVAAAQRLAVDLIDSDEVVDGELRVELMRAAFINAGILTDGSLLGALNSRADRELDGYDPSQRIFLLEGLVRGTISPVEVERSAERLREDAGDLWGSLPLTRRCQTVRTLLVAGERLGGGADRSLRVLGDDVARDASAGGLRRYAREITELLDRG
jgi:transcriptional regulator with XRE-family HTH domain